MVQHSHVGIPGALVLAEVSLLSLLCCCLESVLMSTD